MRHLILGIILGSCLTGGLVEAGRLYDSSGSVQAPKGSVQQFDYFRQRQLFLDVGAMRREADRQAAGRAGRPCLK